jgi:type II secretory pathway component PulJ
VLAEMMISLVIFTTISMGLLMGMVSLERNFVATTDFATNHADAIRISDYLALDLRRALTVQAAQNNDHLSAVILRCERRPQMPTLTEVAASSISSATSSISIHYYLFGGTIYRQEGALPTVAIAENVSDFIFDVTDSGKVVTTRITFNSTYTRSGASAADLGTPSTNTATAVYNTTLLRNSRSDIASGVY